MKTKNQKGITLIALIITIIVMLILVGVSVSVALNTGLFKSAQGAAKNTQLAAEEETVLSSGDILSVGNSKESVSIEEYINVQLGMVEIYDPAYYTERAGLRVLTKVKNNISDIEITELGCMMLPQFMLGEEELTLDVEGIVKIIGSVTFEEDDEYDYYIFYLGNIPEASYSEEIVFRSYVKYTYKGETRILYSNVITTSIEECINNGQIIPAVEE